MFPYGIEEGDKCGREFCEGVMVIKQEPCYCAATRAPCSHCENSRCECDTCDTEVDDKEWEENYVQR